MRCPVLPLAPRPYPGEAISSWVHRIAARYDIAADDLVRHLLGWRSLNFGRAERLDHRADALLEEALAMATRVDVATIKRLRIVCDDGSATSWHRSTPAWCPACMRSDLVERGEVYERAIWRLGGCVLCPDHGGPLLDACRWCVAEAPYRFRRANGRLRLTCSACGHPADPAPGSPGGLNDWDRGALGLCLAPVGRVVRDLQDDLQAALAALPPARTWGLVRSAKGLIAAVRDLTLSLVEAMRLKVARRVALPEPEPGKLYAPIIEPITPAVLPRRIAFGVLAGIAGVLRTLGRNGEAHQQWRPDSGTDLMSAAAFLAWLPVAQRRSLAGLAAGWEEPAGHALRATIAQLQTAS